ncbi:family 43 glycosylhydrolase [Mangrovimonas cancribranchiae]|uniref:Family 43 glycosylhydrolase n=1 Tax=Mangrovimonas cancribranchiae TaxID=3080055 RepID=A0AAU6P629_9FLAO
MNILLFHKKRLTLSFWLILSVFVVNAQKQYNQDLVESGEFINPIFSGDYPDPSILVDGDDFYMVHSSFDYYPGLTIWHSKDLINWNPIANPLTKNVGSVWAPDLVKYDDKFYIYLPVNSTNYVIVADDISGPWSDPIDLKIGRIDPGHVADDDGNRYLYFNDGGYVPLSKDGLSVIGDFKPSYDGWEIPRDWTIECFCLEGPKFFKRGDYYYITVAEGGTAGPATGHMVISARSKSPLGPWENSPYNPIIRAESQQDKWWSVGHATIIEAKPNDWWMVFHGYEKDHYNMGRQTLLAPVEWTDDGWFKLPNDFDLEKPLNKPNLPEFKSDYRLSDNFEGNSLHPKWKFFKNYDANRFQVKNNSLTIKAKGNSIPESSPLLIIPAHHSYSAQVEIELKDGAVGGLVMFYNEKGSSGVLADKNNIIANLRGWQFVTEKNVINRRVFLKIENNNHIVDMYYSLDGKTWQKIESSLEVSGYHHNVLSGFLSLRIGLVAIGEGEVTFKNFKYKAIKK